MELAALSLVVRTNALGDALAGVLHYVPANKLGEGSSPVQNGNTITPRSTASQAGRTHIE
jgi:hypothetical protein